ncbi:phage tail length tape measure family protein [Stenotrophomonas sp. NPDC078853]|uniref:phage tail length tape measure family protein n=1 Tax=Stenotrophomonas sp. NPDC078853 TaxID=3364534 RepID=UPI0038515639
MSRRSLGTLTIDVIAEVGGFVSGLDKSERRAETWRKKVESEAKLAGLALGTAIAAGVVMIARNTVAAEREVAQLDAIIKSTGGAAGYTRDRLLEMADTLSQKSTFSGGEIVEAQTRLLSYSGILGQNIPRAMQSVIDQSARLGISVSQSAETIGRALESPSKAAAALAQSGFGAAFTKEVRGTIDQLVKAGKEGEAQVMILEILEESYGGAAQAARDTFGGALSALMNTLNDLTTGSDGSLAGATEAVNTLIGTLNDPQVREGFNNLVSGAVQAVGALAQLAATTANVAGFIGQEIAARVNGAEIGDPVRIEEQIARQARMIAEFDRSLDARGQPKVGYDPVTGAGATLFNATISKARVELRKSQELLKLSREMAENAARSPKTAADFVADGVTGDPAVRAAAAAAAADADASKKREAAQLQLQRAYEASGLQYRRQIALFDQSADKSGRATELQQINFELAEGALRGLSAQQQQSLRQWAVEIDRLNGVRDANELAAKATEAFGKLKDELNRKDSDGLDLARERLKVLQAAAAVGAANDPEFVAIAAKAISQVGGPSGQDYQGPDALYGGAAGEFGKIDKAVEQQNKRYESQLAALEVYRQARSDLETEWNAKEEKIKADHKARLDALDEARWQVASTAAQAALGSITDVMRTSFGEQAVLYKAAFVVQKAAAIAQSVIAIQQGMAMAAANPWPANLGAIASVAAATAGIVSNIAAVGMAHDGIDKVPETGTWLLQKGERVTTASTSAKLDATLDRVARDAPAREPVTYAPTIQVNGNPDDRTLALIESAVRRGGQQTYERVAADLARGRGNVSKGQQAGFNVKRRVG